MSAFTIFAVILIALLTALFLVRKHLMLFIAYSVNVLFVVFLAGALVTLFLPQVTTSMADFTLKQTGIYKQITDFDKATPNAESLQNNANGIIGAIGNFLNGNKDQNAQTQPQNPQAPGFLEKNLYPNLVTFFGTVFRAFGFLLSIIGLIFAIYIGFYTEQITAYHSMEKRLAFVESQLVKKTPESV